MFKGFRGLPKKAMRQNIKAKGNEALRYKKRHGKLSSKDRLEGP